MDGLTGPRYSILYLGAASGTCLHRADALTRLGHAVEIVDPSSFLPEHRLIDFWNHHTGTLWLNRTVTSGVLHAVGGRRFDLAYVDGGTHVSPQLVRALKHYCGKVVNYNVDDPFGTRDGLRWRQYVRSVREYDLLAVVRPENMEEAHRAGAQGVLHVYRSYDEIAHAPRDLSELDRRNWASQVLFVGTWMPERGPFLAKLIELGVPLTIRGDRWNRAREWDRLQSCWKGASIYGDDYAKAIQCAKVCLGLLSKGNRDHHTQRSMEIPALGGLLCAERTGEHAELYREDQEAVSWSSAAECAEKCRRLLSDEALRRSIAERGRARVLINRNSNEHVMAAIIGAAFGNSNGLAMGSVGASTPEPRVGRPPHERQVRGA